MQVKLRLWRWENYPRLSGWAQCNHKSLYKREARESKPVKGDATMEAEVGMMCLEEWRMGHKPRNEGGL